MESKIITITPEMAKNMLDANMTRNRRVNHDDVRRYARIMKCGGWNLTHQGIAFDTEGYLIDGQHRLMAIIAANVPVTMMATYGVEHVDGSAFTIDVGRKRTTNNIIQISGITDELYTKMSGYVSGYLRFKAGIAHPDPADIIDYIDRHAEPLRHVLSVVKGKATGYVKCGSALHSIVVVAMISAVYRGENLDALEKFAQVYTANDVSQCQNYNPRHALNLREYVRSHKTCTEMLSHCESAIYSFCHNQTQCKVLDNRYPFIPNLDA